MAKHVRAIVPGWKELYRLSDGNHVVVSRSVRSFPKETAAFLADGKGEILNWGTPLERLEGHVPFSKVLARLEG